MRVLVVHNRYRSAQPSGENAVVEEETSLLRGAGVTVEVLSVESDDIASWPAAKRLTLPGRVVWSRDGARTVRRAIAGYRPDVVHFHNTFPLLSPAALRAAHGADVRVVQTLHNFRPLCPAATFLRDGRVCEDCLGRVPIPAVVHGCYRSSRLATLPIAAKDALHSAIGTWSKAVDTYITPSEFARSRYLKAGWPAEQIVVKYNTAPDPGTPGRTTRGASCASPGSRPRRASTCSSTRGAGRFPTAAHASGSSGRASWRPSCGLARRRSTGVELAGQLPRDAGLEILAGARALVVPSRWYEVFPRIVAEAYALGVPVIASRLGSLEEIVADGRTGLHFTPDDAADLGRALRALADDRGLAERLGEGARREYEQHLSPGATTDRLLEIYSGAPPRVTAAGSAPLTAGGAAL